MIIRVSLSPQQVEWYARKALGYWETLEPELAAQRCRTTLHDLLRYLRTVDAAVDLPVVIGERAELPVRLEMVTCGSKFDQGAKRKLSPFASLAKLARIKDFVTRKDRGLGVVVEGVSDV